jgi:hypothetical protein
VFSKECYTVDCHSRERYSDKCHFGEFNSGECHSAVFLCRLLYCLMSPRKITLNITACKLNSKFTMTLNSTNCHSAKCHSSEYGGAIFFQCIWIKRKGLFVVVVVVAAAAADVVVVVYVVAVVVVVVVVVVAIA